MSPNPSPIPNPCSFSLSPLLRSPLVATLRVVTPARAPTKSPGPFSTSRTRPITCLAAMTYVWYSKRNFMHPSGYVSRHKWGFAANPYRPTSCVTPCAECNFPVFLPHRTNLLTPLRHPPPPCPTPSPANTSAASPPAPLDVTPSCAQRFGLSATAICVERN